MRHTWRFVLVLLVAATALWLRSVTEVEQPHARPGTTTCTTFANGQGGGYICARP